MPVNHPHNQEIDGSEPVAAVDPQVPVDYEQSPELQAMLDAAPYALPLPARALMERKLPVFAVPEGVLLNSYVGDLEIRVNQRAPGKTRYRSMGEDVAASSRMAHSRLDLDLEKIREANPHDRGLVKIPAVSPGSGEDRISLLRAPRPSTNKGVNPNSRWFIRGVLHSNPVSLYFGAVATLCVMVSMITSVAAATLLMLSLELPEKFAWVPPWILAFPASLPVCGLIYLIWGLSGRCRICNQKLFVHSAHLKNSKAHRVIGLGYIVPMCVQMILFRWFRCSHCGTAVRLKE